MADDLRERLGGIGGGGVEDAVALVAVAGGLVRPQLTERFRAGVRRDARKEELGVVTCVCADERSDRAELTSIKDRLPPAVQQVGKAD